MWIKPIMVWSGSHLDYTGFDKDSILNKALEMMVRKLHLTVIKRIDLKENDCLSCNDIESCLLLE